MSQTTPQQDYEIFQENKQKQEQELKAKQNEEFRKRLQKEADELKQEQEYRHKCQERKNFVQRFSPSTKIFNTIHHEIENNPEVQESISRHIQKTGEKNINILTGEYRGGTDIYSDFIQGKIKYVTDVVKPEETINDFYMNGNQYATISKGKFKDYRLQSRAPMGIAFAFIFPVPMRHLYVTLKEPFSIFTPSSWF